MRSTREELIRKGVLKESDDVQENHVNKLLGMYIIYASLMCNLFIVMDFLHENIKGTPV